MSKEIYSHEDRSWLAMLPFIIISGLLITAILFSKFFLLGIPILFIVYLSIRKKYYRFKIYTDGLELRNLLSTERKKKEDFYTAQIEYPSEYGSKCIVLKTTDNRKIVATLKNKAHALELVNNLETFGVVFVKHKLYKQLQEWNPSDAGEGQW